LVELDPKSQRLKSKELTIKMGIGLKLITNEYINFSVTLGYYKAQYN